MLGVASWALNVKFLVPPQVYSKKSVEMEPRIIVAVEFLILSILKVY